MGKPVDFWDPTSHGTERPSRTMNLLVCTSCDHPLRWHARSKVRNGWVTWCDGTISEPCPCSMPTVAVEPVQPTYNPE